MVRKSDSDMGFRNVCDPVLNLKSSLEIFTLKNVEEDPRRVLNGSNSLLKS